MRITIDTKEDSKESIRHAIQLLQSCLQNASMQGNISSQEQNNRYETTANNGGYNNSNNAQSFNAAQQSYAPSQNNIAQQSAQQQNYGQYAYTNQPQQTAFDAYEDRLAKKIAKAKIRQESETVTPIAMNMFDTLNQTESPKQESQQQDSEESFTILPYD
ncbi:MAG: hypothetical protein ACMXYK_02310 [Candidatus Woesearchaeota archaeon]